jgi:5-formyltetrahydrofolate cyclo-ligase
MRNITMADKEFIRNIIKDRIKLLSDSYTKKSEELICRRVLELKEYREAKTIFCFVKREKEIDTYPIIQHALVSGKRVFVPKCIDNKEMIACEIKDIEDLEKGMYGIFEPKDCNMAYKGQIDLGIIPCLSCDEAGNRLGYGRGYYDRYLKEAGFSTVALCREKLVYNSIPVEEHDVKVDMIITEKWQKRI